MVALFVLWGCKRKEPEPAPEPPPVSEPGRPPAVNPNSGPEALLRALSVRDGEPDCRSLDALVSDPVASLTEVVATVSMPPQAPMRAARCLVLLHAEAAEPTIAGWMASPDTEGLVRLVLADLSDVPVPVAERLGRAGLAGPHAALVRPALQAATAPALCALAQ